MKIEITAYLLTLLFWGNISSANANETNIITPVFSRLPSSSITKNQTKLAASEFLSCKTGSTTNHSIISNHNHTIKPDRLLPNSFRYLNSIVQATYNKMRNGVIRYVTREVALALLNFDIDGFAAENIASYVSEGTKPYLPFEFANGVTITKVTPKAGTIIYRAELPMTKQHQYAEQLALAGKAYAKKTICNDMEIVDDLLGRHINIQYDYYDINGEFFSSFTING